jgi:hypothetical protein
VRAVGTVLILLFLPALYAAWFRIKLTADDTAEDSTNDSEVRTANVAETSGGDRSASRPRTLLEDAEWQLHELASSK